MKITIATPVRPGVASGNDITSTRWAKRLGELGHDVEIAAVNEATTGQDDIAGGADLLVALHARRSATAVVASRRNAPQRPVVVGLAGTDLYHDLPDDPVSHASIAAADALVVLQPAAIDRLAKITPELAAKAHVVYQSVEQPLPPRTPPQDRFVVAVLAHLRDVKDPLMAAHAARGLAGESRILVRHGGHAHDARWRQLASEEHAQNARYEWLGEIDRSQALELLAASSVLACTSTMEGGANVVTEAIALGVPVVGTLIDGNVGLLGKDYPGLVPVGDSAALGAWLARLESEPALLADLTERVQARSHIADPTTERAAWQAVLGSI